VKSKKLGLSRLRPYTLCFLVTASLLLPAAGTHASSMSFGNGNWSEFGNHVAGTFYVEEGSGTISLWTFNRDGTMIGASSAQAELGFGAQQGTWKRIGPLEIAAVHLDFSHDESGSLKNVARVDYTVRFDRKFRSFEGEFVMRFFDPTTQDPLDLSTYTGEPVTDSFCGRRLMVSPYSRFIP